MGPCTASHCCCLPSPHSAMCHFQVSSHCWWFPFFVNRDCCMASHCCLKASTATLWLHTLFWPRDCHQ
ncbi:unnamed protein product [Staurois parvus]|uniref:Secreted protein n=1 Tax=Staurois parvus TaxID=386267 RepID=A0ABN9E0U9_9NEOB|nr:unnamed protein product [Staurois parvus]